ncbi:MAG: hypothetical protein QM784_16420 [Polyangiaceae bacterium]
MPPRTLSSAIALVGLASLAAIEAGGCGKHSESLRSASRAGLPLVTQATGSISAETTYTLADYGIAPVPGLKHLCGHYELGAAGELVTVDFFESSMAQEKLEQSVRLGISTEHSRTRARHRVTVSVSELTPERIPPKCAASVPASRGRTLLSASRVL